jgi:glycosyltransferase involved in cell wall biosynthesis
MKLSVVIPAYNEEKLIEKCLSSILDQTLDRKDYEIIVIDNNSTDETSEIVKRLGITPILYTDKKGAIWAKQFGANLAKGEIIVITDEDAIAEKMWLESIVKIFENKKLMCVGGTVLATGNNRLAVNILKFFDYFAQGCQVVGIPFIWGTNMAVRKSAFEKVGGFNTNLRTGDDWEFVLRIQKEFGIRSAMYTNKLKVKASPRKQNSMAKLLPYVAIGFINFFSIFIFRKSYTFGSHINVR